MPDIPRYSVWIVNDDDHSFQYVVDLLQQYMRHHPLTAGEMANQIHLYGKAVVYVGHKEACELHLEQIQNAGPDPHTHTDYPLACYIERVPDGA